MPRLLSDSDSDSDDMQSQPSTSRSTTSTLGCPPNMYPPFYPLMNPQLVPMPIPMVMRQDNSGNMVPPSMESSTNPKDCYFLIPIPAKDLMTFPMFNPADYMKHYQSYQNKLMESQSNSSSKTNGLFLDDMMSHKVVKKEKKDENKLVIIDKVPVLKLTRFDHCLKDRIKNKSKLPPLRLMQPVINLERLETILERLELMKDEPSCCICKKTFVTPKGTIMHVSKKHKGEQIVVCCYCGRSFPLRKMLDMHVKLKHDKDPATTIERTKSECLSDSGSSRWSSGLSHRSVSVSLQKLDDEDFRTSDDSDVAITKIVSKKIEEIDLEKEFEEVVSNKEVESDVLSDVKENEVSEEQVSRSKRRGRRRTKRLSCSTSERSETEEKSPHKKTPFNHKEETPVQNETETKEPLAETKTENQRLLDGEIKKSKPKACPRSKKKLTRKINSDGPPAKKSKQTKGPKSARRKNKKPELTSIFRTDSPLCDNCDKINRNVQIIFGDIEEEDLNHVEAKCLMCPEILHFRVEFETHTSSLHLPCLNETRCIITTDPHNPPPDQFIPYKCSHCGIHFVEQRYLDFHKDSVHGEQKANRRYSCVHCGAEFSGNDHYYKHFMALHNAMENAPVEVTRDNYVRMQNSETRSTDPFVCSVCDVKFEDTCELSLHYEDSHTNYSSMCSTCNAAFRTKNETLEHVLTHSGTQSYIVLFKFYNANGSNKSVMNGRNLDANLETSEKPETKTAAQEPVVKKRKTSEDETIDENGSPRFCKSCDKSFSSQLLYKEHAYYIHDSEVDESDASEILRSQNDVLLPTNDTGATAVEELLGAVEVVGEQRTLEETEKDVPEKIVGISSMVEDLDSEEVINGTEEEVINGTEEELMNGIEEEVNELACPICSETFESTEDLNLHLYQSHNDSRGAHVCENCKKILTSIKSVNEHRCTVVDTFKCEYCKTSYENAELLYRHNSKKHLETVGMTVCFCGRMFMTNRMLSYHVKTEHVPIVELADWDSTEYVSEGGAVVHVIPIENEPLDYEDQVLELDKIIDLKEFERVHSETRIDCSYPRRASALNYCPFCKSDIDHRITIDEHFEEKHAFDRETCQLCHTRFQLPRETLHFMKYHMQFSTYTPKSRPKKTSVEKLAYDFIQALSPSSIMSIFLYRLQSDRFMITNQCIICEEDFADLGNCLQHFVNFHDKMCVLCNQVFVTADLAETHKKRKHVSYEAYLWFVLRSANYFANVVSAKEYRSFMPCLCRILGISHELLAGSDKKFKHADDCKSYTDTRTIIQLMKECVEDFGQVKSETRMILLVLDEIFNKYKRNVDAMARSISENSRQFTLDQIKQLLKNYLQSLK